MTDKEDGAPQTTSGRWSRTSTIIGIGATLIVIATGAIALMFQIFPELKPVEAVSAEIQEVTVERGVFLEDYLERSGIPEGQVFTSPECLPGSACAKEFLSEGGLIVYAKVSTRGFRGRAIASPAVFVHKAATGQRATGARQFVTPSPFRQRADSDEAVAVLFVFCPGRYDDLFVQVELSETSGRLIDVERSEPFRCTPEPPPL